MLDQAISYPYSISLGRVSRAKSMRRPKTIIPGENSLQHNPNWSQIPDHPNRILIIVGSKSGKTNANKLSLTNESNKPPNEYWSNLFVCQGFGCIIKRENVDLK